MKKNVVSRALVAAAVISSLLSSTAMAQAQRHGSVVIKRDDYGIPNIYADDTYSLFYGWGYALAEDRLFQMEAVRRASQGKAAEAFGSEYLERDKQMLTNYDPNTLRPQLAKLTGEYKEVLDGMIAGINKRIDEVNADRARLMPKQFNDFGFEPQHWETLDIPMSWVGLLLFAFSDFTSQVSNQAFLTQLEARHGKEKAAKMFATLRWKYDPMAATTIDRVDVDEGRASRAMPNGNIPKRAALQPLSQLAAVEEQEQSIALWNGTGPDQTPHSSNTWLANRTKLIDADAVLVSGPQVGDRVPSMLWAASLHGAGLDVTGMTYPGLPYFHYGTNGYTAWGRTALAGSVLDTYQEQLNPANPRQYRFNGKWRDMEKKEFLIRVKGQAQPVKHEVFATVHGNVIMFDEKNNTAYTKKRAWAGYEIQTMFAYLEENKSKNFKEWSTAISKKANNQSQYYADREGNIALIQAGRYPIRPDGYDIQLPTPGTGEKEWKGTQPFEYNARVLNPKKGFIDNWNNRPHPDMENTDTLLWSRLNRVDAITAQFEAKPKLTVQEVWDINRAASYNAEMHRYFVPLLRDAVKDLPAADRARMLAEAIINWNGQEDDPTQSGFYSSPGYTAFYGWMGTALTALFSQDIPASYMGGCGRGQNLNCPYGQPLGGSVLYFHLTQGKTGSPVPEYDFMHGKAPKDFMLETLAAADKELSAKQGPDIAKWMAPTNDKTWTHQSAMQVPWAGADERIVQHPDQKRGSMNAMYVFKNGKVTMCDSVPPGQSGFIAPDGKKDPHYADQQLLYTAFACKPRRITAEDVEKYKTSEKKLTF